MTRTVTCPRCGAAMTDVMILIMDGHETLHAHCDACDWRGTKKRKAKTTEKEA